MTTSVTELKAAALEYQQLLIELDLETEIKPIRLDPWEPIQGFYVKGKDFRFAISDDFTVSVYFTIGGTEYHQPRGQARTSAEREELVNSVRTSITLAKHVERANQYYGPDA